jgi:ATP-dependent DNA helicase RecG
MMTDINTIDIDVLSIDELLDIVHRVREKESEIIELKENYLKPANISDYIAQFANNRGGLLILGLNDDGTPSGKIKNYTKENENSILEGDLITTPAVGIKIKPFNVPEKAYWIIAIKVPQPTDGIKRISSKGSLIKRVGTRRSVISPYGYSYEGQGLLNASINDLDISLMDLFYSKLKSKVSSITMDRDMTLNLFQILYKDESGTQRPTIAGMILFGKSPDVWVSGTRANIIRYSTLEKSNNIIESLVVTGPILQTIEEVQNKVWNLIRKSNYLVAGQRREISEYPYMVIREAIHNAFFHNDYQVAGDIFIEIFPDRLEIKNMGVPLGGTRLEDLVSKPKHRNRILRKVLSEMGFVEGWGIGLKTMIDNLRTNGLPEPALHVSNEETCLCFRTHTFLDPEILGWIQEITSRSPVDINFHQILALAYTKHTGKITNAIYQNINGVSIHTASNELRELCASGLFISLGRGKSAHYCLTELYSTDEVRLKKYFPKGVILKLRGPQRRILSIIETFGKINAKQIFYQSGYSDERNVKRILNSLVKLNLIKRMAKSKFDPSAYYEINKQYSIRSIKHGAQLEEQLEMDLKI